MTAHHVPNVNVSELYIYLFICSVKVDFTIVVHVCAIRVSSRSLAVFFFLPSPSILILHRISPTEHLQTKRGGRFPFRNSRNVSTDNRQH
jgi:hypothetical protein